MFDSKAYALSLVTNLMYRQLSRLPASVSWLQVISFLGQAEAVGEVVSGILVEQTPMNASKVLSEVVPEESTFTSFQSGFPHLRGTEIYSRLCYRSDVDYLQAYKKRSQANN